MAQTHPSFVVAADTDPNAFGTRWGTLIFTDAFKRLGFELQVEGYPMSRRTAMSDSGEIDGDLGRTAQYGAAHPNLVRVEEPFAEMAFALYTANPALKIKSVEELRASDLIVEYRRGIVFCETTLNALQIKQLSDITNAQQGFKKLLARRSDLYCDLELQARGALNTAEFRHEESLRKQINLGIMPIHFYVHRKHSALAPRLSATIKAMKREGAIEKYRQQVERELGWNL